MDNPSNKEVRDQAILRDVCRYRFTCIATSKVQQFEGKQGGHILKKLTDAGHLEAHARELPGSISFWTVTNSGAKLVSKNDERIKALEGQTLDVSIAIRWWCIFGGVPGRHRLEPQELKEVFGTSSPPANVPHVISLFDATCVESNCSYPAVFRVYLPGGAGASKVVSNLEATIEKASSGLLAKWVKARDYGLLCLVETSAQKEAIETHLKKSRLCQSVLVHVDVAPRAATYKRFLKGKHRES